MKTLKDAKLLYIMNIFLFLLYKAVLVVVGIVIYAYFCYIKCDPFNAGFISNRNQLPPYFVLHVLQDIPCNSGHYISCIFSGDLITLSSGINALDANTVEDIFKTPLRNLPEQKTTSITKFIVLIYGILIIIVAYLAKDLKGSVSQMALSVFGACGGPILSVFLLGASVPRGNQYGAMAGGIVAMTLTIWMSVGNILHGRKPAQLVSPSLELCFTNKTNVTLYWVNVNLTIVDKVTTNTNFSPVEQSDGDISFFLYDVSFEWYGFVGAFVSFVVGVLVSLITYKCLQQLPNTKLIFSILAKFWSLPTDGPSVKETPLEKQLEYELQVQS